MASKKKKPVIEDPKPVEVAQDPVVMEPAEEVESFVPDVVELSEPLPIEPEQAPEPEIGLVVEAEPQEVRPPGPCLWRVSLPGVRVRVEDDQGRFQYQDHMDVTAISAGDAFEVFKKKNGITATIHTPEIGRV